MVQLREVRKRIKAVANIERITKTMQMIATAKFQALVRRAQDTKPYNEKLAQMVAELSTAAGDEPIEHPLIAPPPKPAGQELLLVISSNRGLCGAYNTNVLRTSATFMKGNRDTRTLLQVVGKKGNAFFRFAGDPIEKAHTQLSDEPVYEEIEKLASEYIERFSAGEVDAVRVAYMQFISNARQNPRVIKLLPLEKPEAEAHGQTAGATNDRHAVYEFSPEPAKLLGHLLPLAVKSQLFQCFTDASVSEQIGRMVAMKAATDNAGKMKNSLSRTFNRARQAQITTELSEIIGGAAALE
ncbi:MAG: ATP synthase F1 subunit gamma [Phycisphaerae bacterium]|nr:ATP synthase F1 subunit gamma [Phycisphaerae bacterium]